MPRPFEMPDGRVVEMHTPEEQADLQARYAATEIARRARIATEPTWLADIPAMKARVIVEALAEATYGEPMVASKVFEVCRRFGLSPDGSWPDSTSQVITERTMK